MNINELFKKLQEEIQVGELKGELTLKGKCIVWTYDLDDNSEEIESPTTDDDDEPLFNFEAQTPEELLMEAYQEDLERIQEFLDEYEEFDNWTFSDPEINDQIISFRLF
jgi:hypothetical protein